MLRQLIPVLAFTLLANSAHAHHGRDFLMVQDYATPVPLTGIVYGNFEYAALDGRDEWTLEPGVMMGIAPGFALGTAVAFADAGDGWDYSSITPQLQVQLTPAGSSIPIRFGVIAGYEFARDEAHGHEEEHEHEHGESCGPEFGPDAPACEVLEAEHEQEHSHGGIHQHGADNFFARLIMETDLTEKDKLVVNILCVSPKEGEAAFGYAAGLRHSFHHDLAVGIEATGDFDSDGYHEAVFAGYFSPSHNCTFKLGIGAGLTDESPDLSVRGGAVWRF